MTPAVFAFLSDAKDAISEFAHNCLLIAGGFLVGYILGGLACWALGKWVLRQEDPATLKRVGRPIGGILLALIVAIIVFTGKGKPMGEGGDGKGTPSTDPDGGKGGAPKVDPKIEPNPDLKKPPDVKPADAIIRVTIYGGAKVMDGKAYQLDDDRSLITFDQLKKAIVERKAAEKGKVTVAILYPDDPNEAPGNPPDGLHSSVAQVVRWARSEAKLGVEFAPDK